MYRLLVLFCLVAVTAGVAACNGYGDSSPTGPTGQTPPRDGAIVIDIVGIAGARSFSPNPATVPAGQTLVWHHMDTTTPRVVLDDRGLDTGNIAPGAFSAAMTLPAPRPYHCSIHREMVGAVNDR